MDIEKELKEILENNNSNEWQTKSIKALAFCMLEQRKDICIIRKQLGWYKWLLGTIIILLVVNLFR
jgi:hypothetical protein